MVEQDLVLCRALVEIFNRPELKDQWRENYVGPDR